ncbi:MAG: glycosyltransferase [Deferribacteraceae bacterium]|jgi:glycosyltransferase involved in cell wall biosynthesis|nr:glycosyltransferase [Deferribacteraceae bacterium]
MRIVIDMQGVQTANRFHDIGTLTRELTKAIIRNRGCHEIFLALNGAFDRTIREIREYFNNLIPEENIRVWYAPIPTHASDPANIEARKIAEKIREAFIASLSADAVLIPSLFEGWGDNAVTSIGVFDKTLPAALILHDITPFLPTVCKIGYKKYCHEKMEYIKRSSLILSISESLRNEVVELFQIEESRVQALTDDKQFSWDKSAQKAIKAIEELKPQTEAQEKVIVQNVGIFNPQYKKILILKLDHMGDFLLALPAITKLKARYPYSMIDIVVGSWNLDLAKSTKLFNKIFTFDFYKRVEGRTVCNKDCAELLSKLDIYDIAIDLRRYEDTRFILKSIRAQLKIGYEAFEPSVDECLDIKLPSEWDVKYIATGINNTSVSYQMLSLIDAIPSEPNDCLFFPSLSNMREQKGGFIAIFPKAGYPPREWPYYRELIISLMDEIAIVKINLYFADTEEAAEFTSLAGGKVLLNIGMGFNDLTHSLSENCLCIANNSGGAHLASYLGLPVLAIYSGHEKASEWAPAFNRNTFIVQHCNLECSPCHDTPKCERAFFCLTDITVDFIFRKVMEFVNNGRITETAPKFNNSEDIISKLLYSIADASSGNISHPLKVAIADCVAATFLPSKRKKQLLIDISTTMRFDAKTGIQRVTRNILYNLLINPPDDYDVMPIYFSAEDNDFFYAKRFTKHFINGTSLENGYDLPVQPMPGDIFLGLDMRLGSIERYSAKLREIRNKFGVKLCFIIYDLIAFNFARYFENYLVEYFKIWLHLVADSDIAVCISKTTASDLIEWLQDFAPNRIKSLVIKHSYSGVGEDRSLETTPLSKDEQNTIKKLSLKPSFLMVGTLEPRKGHRQVIAAFEELWKQGLDLNLVIVGKKGWLVDNLAQEIDNHRELGHRLFWLKGISDVYLEEVYNVSAALIAASKAEGFGLPLIEAAQHKLPIIARDIPIFREVAGENAYYFSGVLPENLADALIKWLELYKDGKHPNSDKMQYLTWKESTENLLKIIIDN